MPPVAVTEFQDALAELAARSGEATDRLLARISALSPAEARAFITDAYPALLTPYMAASAQLTTQWYAEQPVADAKPGAKVFVPTPAPLAQASQLAISGRWALTQTAPTVALQGNATRQVLNASRQTVEFNARAEGARWIRKAKPNACGFCKMLATRAALQYDRFKGRDLSYASTGVRRKLDRDGNLTKDYTLVVIGRSGRSRNKTGRARKLGSEYHDHCRCTAVPLRDGIYEPPDYVERWTDEYIEAFDRFGGDAAAISQALDLGRIRPDRVTAVAEDVATAATAAAAPAAPAAAPVTAPELPPAEAPTTTNQPLEANPLDQLIAETSDVSTSSSTVTVPVDVLKRYTIIDPYNPVDDSAEAIKSARDYQRGLENKIKTDGLESFKNRPVLTVGADGKYALIEDGNHRIGAADKVGVKEIDVVIQTGEDSDWARQYGRPVDDDVQNLLDRNAGDIVAPARPPQAVVAELDELDQTIADAMDALEAGDETLAATLFDKAEKLEAAQKAKAAKVAAKQAADDATRAAQSDRIIRLIDDEGYTPAQAEAEVFNVSVESIIRRDFIIKARAEGHQGAGFDELLTSVYRRQVEDWYWKAEAEVGVLIKSRYIGRFDDRKLWTVNEATARKVMSDEMAAWFDANGGRVTRATYRDSILSGSDTFDTAMQQDFLQ